MNIDQEDNHMLLEEIEKMLNRDWYGFIVDSCYDHATGNRNDQR